MVFLDLSNAAEVWFGDTEASEIWVAGQKVWEKQTAFHYFYGFETTDLDGWTGGIGVTVSRVNTQKFTGTYSMLANVTSSGNRRVQKTITGFNPGKTYQLTFWVRTPSSSSTNSFKPFCDGVATGPEVDPSSSIWTWCYVDFVASSSTHTVGVEWTQSNTSQDPWIDSVDITQLD